MAKLRIAELIEDKPLKVTSNCRRGYTAISSRTLNFWPGKTGNRSVSPTN
jgi:hypothetical protein